MKVNRKKGEAINQNDEGPRLMDIFRQSPIAIELYDKDGKTSEKLTQFKTKGNYEKYRQQIKG